MGFLKDILIIDFEGPIEPVQIGALLLDKNTLEEKDSFISYIYADMQGKTAKKSGISQKTLKSAPSQAEVGKMIFDRFGTDILLGSWVDTLDVDHFTKIITAAGLSWKEYDYHVLDIWPAAYIHLIKRGYTGPIDSESMFQFFNAEARGLHNALEDCKIAANVLRKILKD